MRCSICDYADGHGSDYLGIPPSPNIRVTNHKQHGPICTSCMDSVQDTMNGYAPNEEEEDVIDVAEDAPALS